MRPNYPFIIGVIWSLAVTASLIVYVIIPGAGALIGFATTPVFDPAPLERLLR